MSAHSCPSCGVNLAAEPDYTYEEAAVLLRTSVRSVEAAKRERKLGFYRDGSRITFGASHIRAYRSRNEVKPETEAKKLKRVS